MATTTFSNGTVVAAAWANDVNDRVYDDVINVMNAPYSAVGDGVTDDYTAINAAITAAVALGRPCKIVFPARTYKINTVLSYYTGANNIYIEGNGAVLDFSGVGTGGTLLGFQGTYGSTAALTSNTAVGDKTISVTSSGFTAGDMVRLYSSTVWDASRTNTKIGEINFIETVPGGTSVTLVAEVESAYTTAATATLQKLTPISHIRVDGLHFVGPAANDTLLGLDFKCGQNITVTNCYFYDIDVLALRFYDCVFWKATHNHFKHAANATQAYGISATDASQHGLVAHNTFIDIRHSFTTNNTVSTSYGITRDIIVQANVSYDTAPDTGGVGGDTYDTHAGADRIHFFHNQIKSSSGLGFNMECKSGSIVGNQITSTAIAGIKVHSRTDQTSSYVISDNVINLAGDNTGTNDYAIQMTTVNAAVEYLVISNNKIRSKNQLILVDGNATYPISYVSIQGNVASLLNSGLSSPSTTAVDLTYVNYGSLAGNTVVAQNLGYLLTDCSHINVTGNTARVNGTSGSTAYGVRLAGASTYCTVNSNNLYFSGSGITTTIGVSLASTATNNKVDDNLIRGFAAFIDLNTGEGNTTTGRKVKVTLADDAATSFAVSEVAGLLSIQGAGTAGHGLIWVRPTSSPSSSKYAGASTCVAVNTTLAGTTGTDGNVTVGVQQGLIYVENRSGVSSDFEIHFSGG